MADTNFTDANGIAPQTKCCARKDQTVAISDRHRDTHQSPPTL